MKHFDRNAGRWAPDEVVGANIRRLRKAARLSQAELAGKLHDAGTRPMDRNRLSRIERGTEPVKWAHLVALAYALDVTIYDLVLPPDEWPNSVVIALTERRDSETGDVTGRMSLAVIVDHYAQMLFAANRANLTRERLEKIFPLKDFDAGFLQGVSEAINRMIHKEDLNGDA